MAGSVTYLVRAEGVNFEATLDDTQDLSTIRGAGLALLGLGKAIEAGLLDAGAECENPPLFTGASQALYRCLAPPGSAPRIRAAIEARFARPGPGKEPFEHLSFVVDVVEGDDEQARTCLEARNRGRQFRQWTVPLPDFAAQATRCDPVDRVRPATVLTRVPAGKFPDIAGESGREALLSPSVAARRAFGKQMRQGFYREHAGRAAENLAFCDSFEEIVGDPPEVPVSSRSRIAVVYADGNGFGDIRKRVGAEYFSTWLAQRHEALLAQILGWYRLGAQARPRSFATIGEGGELRLRLETLRWGGDEFVFVMPSWLAFAFVEGFFAATADWAMKGEALTHAMGVVICHHKTPIRQARVLAEEIVGEVKREIKKSRPPAAARAADAVGIEIFESLPPPQDDLTAHRARLYGVADAAATDEFAAALIFPGQEFAALRARCRGLKRREDGLSRSQLFRALRSARKASGGLASIEASVAVRNVLQDYEKRVRKAADFTASGLRLPRLDGSRARSLAVELVLLASFWDYVDPFVDDQLPAFPTGGAAL